MKRNFASFFSFSLCLGLAVAAPACAGEDPADGARTDELGMIGTIDPVTGEMMPAAPGSVEPGTVPPQSVTPQSPALPSDPNAVAPITPTDAINPVTPADPNVPAPVDPSQAVDPNQMVAPGDVPATPVDMPVTPVDMPVTPADVPVTPSPVDTAPAAADELLPDQCTGIKKDMACPADGTCSNLSCGLADTGTRTCTCATTWACTSCAFPTGADAPAILTPPTADAPLSPCDTTTVVEKEVCTTMGERCSLGEDVCACWLTNSDGLTIWDCDSAPSTW